MNDEIGRFSIILCQACIDLLKIRGQAYDGANVMSGDKGGVNIYISHHLEQNGVLSPALFVHCASHNLNLVVNDAVESNVLSVSFLGVLAETFSFLTEALIDLLILRSLATSTSRIKISHYFLKSFALPTGHQE